MPNVDLIKEMSDAMAANQALSANITAFKRPEAGRGQGTGDRKVSLCRREWDGFARDTRRRDEYECASNR